MREDRGTCCPSRVDDTAEALFVACSRPVLKRGGRRGDAQTGSPAGAMDEGTMKVPRTEAKPRTVHAAWWSSD